MVLEKLSEAIQNSLRKLSNIYSIDEPLINEIIKDIQKSLIMSDVDIKLVLQFSKNLKKKALNEKKVPGITIREHIIKIIYDELLNILGPNKEIDIKKQKIMLVGLQGSGKTTTISKLAYFYQKKGLKVSVIGLDVYRPGAYEQLKSLCDKNKISYYSSINIKDPIIILKEGLSLFQKYDIILIDTAGRHSLENELIDEIKKINEILKPDNKYLVLDSGIGQQSKIQAKSFNDAIGITGIILTKLDGTSKGGGAISAISETKVPVSFIGTGEKIEDLESFDPKSFISRLLGFGDIKLLLNKIKENIKEDDINQKNLYQGKFTLNDMYQQLETIKKLGPLKQIYQLLPIGTLFGSLKISDNDFENINMKINRYKTIMNSMTKEERNYPKIINNERIIRISKGSGVSIEDIKELLKHYNSIKSMLKNVKSIFGHRFLRR